MDDTEIERKRAIIAGVYPGENWKTKVNNMSSAQIIAVYIRLRDQGKLG